MKKRVLETIIESISVKRKDGTCVSFTFLEDGKYKTIIDDDYDIDIQIKSSPKINEER